MTDLPILIAGGGIGGALDGAAGAEAPRWNAGDALEADVEANRIRANQLKQASYQRWLTSDMRTEEAIAALEQAAELDASDSAIACILALANEEGWPTAEQAIKKHTSPDGPSLGGFVSATAGSLDDGYDNVFLMLAGGELYDLIQNGKKDAAKVRERLEKAGLKGEELRKLTLVVEPTRIAHRLKPERTWLYSGIFDTVVPPKNALALANAASLTKTHHIQMTANHYTGIVYLPFVLSHIARHAHHPVTPEP